MVSGGRLAESSNGPSRAELQTPVARLATLTTLHRGARCFTLETPTMEQTPGEAACSDRPGGIAVLSTVNTLASVDLGQVALQPLSWPWP